MASLGLGLAVALMSEATAGDYHSDTTLLCAQCHVMHFSQSHGYNPNGSGFISPLGGAGPYHYLLRDEVNNLCLSCHDNSGIAPDVLGSFNGGNHPGDVRLGGYLNRLGIEGLAPTGHTLDALDEAPGSSPPWKPEDDNGTGEGLNCTNCHQQHGYAGGQSSYRNLKMDPGNLGFLGAVVTYNDGAPNVIDLTKDVFQRAERMYDESDMDWNEPDSTTSKIAKWCGGCHTNFHGVPGDANIGGVPTGISFTEFLRHPVGGVNIGDVGGGHSSLAVYNAATNKVKVMSEVGVWDPAGTDVSVTCISCHKAHGNGNAFGLLYRSGTGTLTENGDSNGAQLEALCSQCHVQASAFANP
jgi:hypothetical protein